MLDSILNTFAKTYSFMVSKKEKTLTFHVHLIGKPKSAITKFRDEWKEKYGRKCTMGNARITEILLTELYLSKYKEPEFYP